MIGSTGYTTQEVSDAVGIPIQMTTQRMRQLEDRLRQLCIALRRVHPELRGDRLATMITAVVDTGGRLAAADRARFRGFVRSLAG